MTAEQLIREVRQSLIEDARDTRVHELCGSKAFLKLAQGYSAANRDIGVAAAGGPTAVDNAILAAIAARQLHNLIIWLTKLQPLVCDTPPLQLLARADEQSRLRRDHIKRLREIAATVTEKYASRLNAIAQEMEIDDGLALQDDYDVNLYGLVNPKYLGRSGSATTNAKGAWRGLFIRQMRSRLPEDLNLIPQPYATMAELLTWAGIDGVTPPLVRSILKRGHT